MKALSLSMGPTINSNMFSKWFNDALVFIFFSFYIQYTSHLFTSQLVLWKLLNIKVIMNLSVPQCVLQFLCLVPDNKELHL